MSANSSESVEAFLYGVAQDVCPRGEHHPGKATYTYTFEPTEPESSPVQLIAHYNGDAAKPPDPKFVIRNLELASEEASVPVFRGDRTGSEVDVFEWWFVDAIGSAVEAQGLYPPDHELMVCLRALRNQRSANGTGSNQAA